MAGHTRGCTSICGCSAALYTVVKERRIEPIYPLALFALSAILSTGINYPVISQLYLALYSTPLGWLIRSPGKFPGIVAASEAMLASLLVARAAERGRRILIAATAVCIAAALLWGLPLAEGSIAWHVSRHIHPYSASLAQLPVLLQQLVEENPLYTVAFIPSEVVYCNRLDYGMAPRVSVNPINAFVFQSRWLDVYLSRIALRGECNKLVNTLEHIGVRYVVLRLDYNRRDVNIARLVDAYRRCLDEDARLVRDLGVFRIYELPGAKPAIRVSSITVYSTNPPAMLLDEADALLPLLAVNDTLLVFTPGFCSLPSMEAYTGGWRWLGVGWKWGTFTGAARADPVYELAGCGVIPLTDDYARGVFFTYAPLPYPRSKTPPPDRLVLEKRTTVKPSPGFTPVASFQAIPNHTYRVVVEAKPVCVKDAIVYLVAGRVLKPLGIAHGLVVEDVKVKGGNATIALGNFGPVTCPEPRLEVKVRVYDITGLEQPVRMRIRLVLDKGEYVVAARVLRHPCGGVVRILLDNTTVLKVNTKSSTSVFTWVYGRLRIENSGVHILTVEALNGLDVLSSIEVIPLEKLEEYWLMLRDALRTCNANLGALVAGQARVMLMRGVYHVKGELLIDNTVVRGKLLAVNETGWYNLTATGVALLMPLSPPRCSYKIVVDKHEWDLLRVHVETNCSRPVIVYYNVYSPLWRLNGTTPRPTAFELFNAYVVECDGSCTLTVEKLSRAANRVGLLLSPLVAAPLGYTVVLALRGDIRRG